MPEDETGKFLAGDNRRRQTPQLALVHSVVYRFHNKVAEQLAAVNKKWNDNKLFFESRRIVIAIYQKIIYEEWLPLFIGLLLLIIFLVENRQNNFSIYVSIIIGKELCASHKFICGEERYDCDEDEYDENIDPSASVEFAHNAFRVLHRNIPSGFRLKGKKIQLSDVFSKAELLKENDNYDEMVRGLLRGGMLVNRPGYSPEV